MNCGEIESNLDLPPFARLAAMARFAQPQPQGNSKFWRGFHGFHLVFAWKSGDVENPTEVK